MTELDTLRKLGRLRTLIEGLRQAVESELQGSRSVSVALTNLDTAELWLARAVGEQSGVDEAGR